MNDRTNHVTIRKPRWREGEHRFAKMYDTRTWRLLRDAHLKANPLCELCLRRDRTTAGTVVHHKVPHRGDWSKFRDPSNLETACKSCHDGELQLKEKRGFSNRVGLDGFPLDEEHPFNKT